MNSFNDLKSLQRELDALFFRHQQALILGSFDTALQRLETYEQKVVDHILDPTAVVAAYSARAQQI